MGRKQRIQGTLGWRLLRVLIATLIGYLIAYLAYKSGYKKGYAKGSYYDHYSYRANASHIIVVPKTLEGILIHMQYLSKFMTNYKFTWTKEK